MRKKLTVILLLLIPNFVTAKECVALLHGLARTTSSMQKMANEFEKQGYEVANISYPSRKYEVKELTNIAMDKVLSQCTDAEKIHFVTHSLGGILVRHYLANNTMNNLGRVVMLAPPNQGSEIVDDYRSIPGVTSFNGPAFSQLGTDDESIPLNLGKVNFELGVIAGTRTINLILSQSLRNPDDGKVSVEKTKVEGMTDFLVVAASHTFIMKKEDVIQQAIHFIQLGKFKHEEKE